MSTDYSPTQSIEFAVKNITKTTNYKKLSGTDGVQKAASRVIKVEKRGLKAPTMTTITTTTRPATEKTVKTTTTTIRTNTKLEEPPTYEAT
jgi:hypothetical protein